MGQYHMVVNLDKREYISPHKLGCGLKLWEQLANGDIGGTGGALLVLLACSNGRGGGDFDTGENWNGPEREFPRDNTHGGPMPEEYPAIAARTIGRWAGDRIAVVGDYAEDGDLAPEHHAGSVYTLCHDREEVEESAGYAEKMAVEAEAHVSGKVHGETAAQWRERAEFLRGSGPFTDVSDDVLTVLTHELHLVVDETQGWREIRRAEEGDAIAPDTVAA